jgi:dihydrofolate reductase
VLTVSQLFLQIAVSLDGYIEDASGDIGWMTTDASFDARATETLRSIEGMILGRKSHELFARFWPTAGDAPGASSELKEQAELMKTLPKYVLTHGTEPTGWENSQAITVDDVAPLKRKAARPIALFAGAHAAQSLLEHDLLDELRLVTYPVLLGDGTPLFPRDGKRRTFTLVDTEHFSSGATLQRYRLPPVARLG